MVLNLYLFDYTISLLTLTKLKYLLYRIQCLNKTIFKVTPFIIDISTSIENGKANW